MFLVEKFGAYKRSRQHRRPQVNDAGQEGHIEDRQGQQELIVKVTDKELSKLQRKIVSIIG